MPYATQQPYAYPSPMYPTGAAYPGYPAPTMASPQTLPPIGVNPQGGAAPPADEPAPKRPKYTGPRPELNEEQKAGMNLLMKWKDLRRAGIEVVTKMRCDM